MTNSNDFFFSNIAHYSIASTSEAAYIIGGYYTTDIIAEFKNNSWRQMGTLAKGRNSQGSITLNDETMVIGGWSNRGLVYFYGFNYFYD